ncbi:hypothetical protein GAMM_50015 [Gammaproteobacteria bacterium]
MSSKDSKVICKLVALSDYEIDYIYGGACTGDCVCDCVCSSTPDCEHGKREVGIAPSILYCAKACVHAGGYICQCTPITEEF